MKTKNYMHPVTRKIFEVQTQPFTTQHGTIGHVVSVRPISGGVWARFIRYSHGEYRKLMYGKLCPVSITDYYPGLTMRGVL